VRAVARKTILWVLGLGPFLMYVSSCATNPITGDQELMFFSSEEDMRLGRKYAPYVENALEGRIADENIQSYVNQIGQRIARVCDSPDLSYSFLAVEEERANALALPGGYIYITRGLLQELKSEAQLASILGHEVGHVVARDTVQTMSREIGMAALVTAALASEPRVGGASTFVGGLLNLQYSREDEEAADKVGLLYMVKAGYDPNGMLETLQILQELNTIRPIEFFSTHPNPESRIAYITEKIERRYADAGTLKRGEEEYHQRVLLPLKERRRNFQTPAPEPPAGQ
jgi:predicted Zn-dependent protease